jgi:hypothetical protein
MERALGGSLRVMQPRHSAAVAPGTLPPLGRAAALLGVVGLVALLFLAVAAPHGQIQAGAGGLTGSGAVGGASPQVQQVHAGNAGAGAGAAVSAGALGAADVPQDVVETSSIRVDAEGRVLSSGSSIVIPPPPHTTPRPLVLPRQ